MIFVKVWSRYTSFIRLQGLKQPAVSAVSHGFCWSFFHLPQQLRIATRFWTPGTPWPPTSHGEKPTQLQAMEVIDFFWPSSGHLDCHDQNNDFTIILLAWSLIISTGYGEDHGRTLYDQCFYYYCRGFQLSQSLFNLKMADKNWRQHNFKTFTLKLKSEQKTCLKKNIKNISFLFGVHIPKNFQWISA